MPYIAETLSIIEGCDVAVVRWLTGVSLMTILKEQNHDGTRTGAKTYRAFQTTGGGLLELRELPIVDPKAGQVRLRVEACGVCHTDAFTIEGGFPGLTYPRVPGHEVIGTIDAIGSGVIAWTLGQRVGVGFFAGPCGHCTSCKRGSFVNCLNQTVTGVHGDGGYAEMMIADQAGLVSIPEQLSSVEAAPLLCAGVTTFMALRNSPARAGDLVVIQGLGGLGHLAVQFARRMGFRTIVVARGADKAALAEKLGAHQYIDSNVQDATAILQGLGGANLVLTTVSDPKAMAPMVAALGPNGRLHVVGGGTDPLEVSTIALLFGQHSIAGSSTGSTIETEDTLAFSLLQNIRATIETVPFEQAPAAYQKMLSNGARFRMVLSMDATK